MTPWLTIMGVSEGGWEALSGRARLKLEQAERVIGADRMFNMLPGLKAEKHSWPQPFSGIVEQLAHFKGRKTVLLATGDPMNFGVARKVLEFIPKEEVEIITNLSALSLAAAELGWSLPDCDCFTIHGRPAANLELFIQPGAHLLILTQDQTSVAEICRRLIARGFENSEVTVLEDLGATNQCVTTFNAAALEPKQWSALNTVAIHCVASRGAKIYSRVAGLPDDAFAHDGQLTKREVRAATLAALAPAPGELLWDVGAGCGSISIEWMRSTRGCEAIAIEPNPDRVDMIKANIDRLGTPRLEIIAGKAPDALDGLPNPDAIFIGGGISDDRVFEISWAALRSGGRMVANVVTIEGEAHIYDLQKIHGGDLVRMDVSTLTPVGPYRALKPRMAVTQWRVHKP